jgi:hypothetical protein
MGWFDKVKDAAGDIAGGVVDVVTDPVGTVAAPVFEGALGLGEEIAEHAGPVLSDVADTVGGVIDDPLGTAHNAASWVHHTGLDHLPGYRAADGFVHDVKHVVQEFDWRNPTGLQDAVVDLAGSTALRGVHALADTVDAFIPGGETLRFNDLDADSQKFVRDTYGNSVEYEDIRIVAGGLTTDLPLTDGSGLTPHVIGNTIYLPADYLEENAAGEPSIVDSRLDTFAHEVGHVWQNQNGGGDYAAEALYVQGEAYVTTGNRNNAYRGFEELHAGTAFEDLNPEEQADVAEHIAVRLDSGDPLTPELQAAWDQIRAGDGAP